MGRGRAFVRIEMFSEFISGFTVFHRPTGFILGKKNGGTRVQGRVWGTREAE